MLTAWCAQHEARWLGHVADVQEVWRHADIFVLPARSREGMPRALLEAAACARPLVVTDVPGCRHFVRDGVEGFIVPPEDAEALADALERLARDPELRLRMGEAARLRLLHGFTEAHVKQSLRAAYASMFGRREGLMTRAVRPASAGARAGPPTTAIAAARAGTGYLVDTSASAMSAALAAATRQTTPGGVAPPSTAR